MTSVALRIQRLLCSISPLRLAAADNSRRAITCSATFPVHPLQVPALGCIHRGGSHRALPHISIVSPCRYFTSVTSLSSSPLPSSTEVEEKWYDSHSADATSVAPYGFEMTSAKATSAKSFKDIPIHTQILAHIEALGVGIRPRRDHRNTKKINKKRGRQRLSGANGLLDDTAEKEFFNRQRLPRRQAGKRQQYQADRKSGSSSIYESSAKDKSSWLPPIPFSAASIGNERTNEGHKVKRLPVKILGSASSIQDVFPKSSKGLAEVALAGRSNVGKSTLLNALLYGNKDNDGEPLRRRLGRRLNPDVTKLPRGKKAVVSSKPGETKDITLYQLSSEIVHQSLEAGKDINKHSQIKYKISLVLSDLPGYGFSYVSEEKAKDWKELMQHYLLHRGKSLKRILLLIDARHGMKNADSDFLHTLQQALKENADIAGNESGNKKRHNLPPIQIVLTKCDLVKQKDLARRVVLTKQQLSDALHREPSSLPIMLVSAKPGIGYNNVRGERARGGVLELQKELAALVPSKQK